MMMRAFIGLGGKLGDVRTYIDGALEALAALPHTSVQARSRLYRTPPWGMRQQPPFINAAAQIETALPPLTLLDALLAIERGAGRQRSGARWGPRTLDLDLLLYGDRHIDMPDLKVPHPRLAQRAFVLLPLHDLAPQRLVPGQGVVAALLAAVDTRGCHILGDGA